MESSFSPKKCFLTGNDTKRANLYSVAEMNATRRSPAMVSPALERLVIEGTPVLCATIPS